MKIGVQTLKGQKHQLEVAESDTVLAVKQRIASELGLGDASEQKLIYLGKILSNDATIAQTGIKPGEMVVVMVSKLKRNATAAAAAAPAAATPAAAASSTPAPAPAAAAATTSAAAPTASAAPAAPAAPATAASTPAATSTPTAAATTTPASTPAATATTPSPSTTAATPATASSQSGLASTAASSIAMGSAYEESILNLMALGFERQQVVDALRAAYNNADRAAEYLFGPPEVLRAALAQASSGRAAAPQAAAGGAGGAASPAQQQQQSAGAGGAGAGGASTTPSDLLNLVSSSGIDASTINQLQSLLQSNPQLVPLLLQQVAQSNPELMQQLGEDPQALERALQALAGDAGAGAGGGGGARRRRAQNIQLNDEEKAQIDNLEGLGFNREAALEAWLLCDRNSEMAASYLLEHGGEIMDEDLLDEEDEDADMADEHQHGDMGGGMGDDDDEDEDFENRPYYE